MADLISEHDGIISYHTNGKLHREGGPAVLYEDGSEEWFINGIRHREDGPALIRKNIREKWFYNGVRHRIGGPAVIYYGEGEEWWVNGKRHRIDGPAFKKKNKNDQLITAWWINGKPIKSRDIKEIFDADTKFPLSEEQIVLLKLLLS